MYGAPRGRISQIGLHVGTYWSKGQIIIECLGWKGPQIQSSSSPLLWADCYSPGQSAQVSNLALNTSRVEAFTTSQGSLGWGLTTLSEKFSPTSNLSFPSFSLKAFFSAVLHLVFFIRCFQCSSRGNQNCRQCGQSGNLASNAQLKVSSKTLKMQRSV